MRLYKILRTEDVSGVSGTGIVAEAVEFTNGKVVLQWLTPGASMNIYDNMAIAQRIHGHEGRTRFVSYNPVKDDDDEEESTVRNEEQM